jgi:hypothetical protein
MYYLRLFTLLFLATALITTTTSCDDDEEMMEEEMEMEMEENTVVVWSGETITFTKADGANPADEANQDRITDNVWITRGNTGGQIYNAVVEASSDKDESPTGTLWAVGTTADIENLEFTMFRAAVEKPKDAVGIDLVMLLVQDSIALDLKITSWSQGTAGGFAYERSSE